MDNLNCPNCGAPIRGIECQYCGTMFYDFASIRDDRPSYIRIKNNDNYIVCRAVMDSANFYMQSGEFPQVDISFTVLPDDRGVQMYMIERRTNE